MKNLFAVAATGLLLWPMPFHFNYCSRNDEGQFIERFRVATDSTEYAVRSSNLTQRKLCGQVLGLEGY